MKEAMRIRDTKLENERKKLQKLLAILLESAEVDLHFTASDFTNKSFMKGLDEIKMNRFDWITFIRNRITEIEIQLRIKK